MNESLKRRLVGATVLVSLIVIFVPMLLEDESGRPPAIEGSNIPPRPDWESGVSASRVLPLEDEPLAPPAQVPDLPEPEVMATAPGSMVPDRLPVWKDRPERDLERRPEPTPASESAAEPLPEPEPAAQEPVSLPPEPEEPEVRPPVETPEPQLPTARPATPAPKPLQSRPAKAPAPPPAEPPRAAARSDAAPPKTAETAWAIQVGSFSDRTNADKLVQELRAARYPAFREETQVQGNTLHRVRVGPEEDRELADAMAAGIAKRFKLNGQVVSYP